jgi:carbamoyl-phosphate synthase large subunit
MGLDDDYGTAFAKSQSAAYSGGLPDSGTVFVSVADRDKRAMIFPVKRLVDLGFRVIATPGTAEVLRRNGVESSVVRKRSEGPGADGEPTVVQRILAGEVDMVVNTPSGRDARADGYEIRAATTSMDRPIITTVQQLAAAVQGIEAARDRPIGVRSLQEHGAALRRLRAGESSRVAGGLADLEAGGQSVGGGQGNRVAG